MLRLRYRSAPLLPALALLVLSVAMNAHAQRAAVPPPSAPQGNCTHHDPATRPDCPAAIAFLAKFQDALKSNDHNANYPSDDQEWQQLSADSRVEH